uniref:Serotonin receptor-like planarian receptor 1 n=1 Tax=Dugesia japonica TaxID=6161 RepID=O15970_DUGJA|nr:serotonin receptor-like planarian receptor 1 [Dugesia japonica]
MSTINSTNCTFYFQLASKNNSAVQVPFYCIKFSFEFEVFLIIVLTIFLVGTAGGNLLVISSVAIVKKLQTSSNFLIVNLACSDFLVSILVLPGAVHQVIYRGQWPFSEILCDIFISFDVILCTSSILNLCAISIDRYLVITRPLQYAVNRTPARIGTMVAISWVTSALISIPPMFGLKETFIPGQCNYSDNLIYQIYATFGAFYIPLIVMLILYGRIFKLAREMAQNDAKLKIGISPNSSDKEQHSHLRIVDSHICNTPNGQMNLSLYSGSLCSISKSNNLSDSSPNKVNLRNRVKLKSSTETKAITTLGVIMGCFTICWLPFFLIQISKPVLKVANVDSMNYFPIWLIELCLWLGYFNSFLNPIIYAKFNREFRTPFKQILLCKCNSINARLRSETFVQEYGLPNSSAPTKRGSFDQTSLNNGSFTKNRRRRTPGVLRQNPHLNNCKIENSRKIYECSLINKTNKFPPESSVLLNSIANGNTKPVKKDTDDNPFHFSDQISPNCSINDQRSEKMFMILVQHLNL